MKLIEITAPAECVDCISAIAEEREAQDFRLGPADQSGLHTMRMLASDDRVQPILDALQTTLAAQAAARVLVIAVEVSLPQATDEERKKEDTALAAREALYDTAEKSARLDLNYVILVLLSTLVAAIGLMENNVAVVIGAMVIAPLLGPNMAFGMGTALGDTALMKQASKSLAAGIAIAIAMSALIGIFWPIEKLNPELLSRTEVNLAAVALALASGAAAALSLTTGLSSVLVGVMVAVALLPPAATVGLMLGHGRWELAAGAALLLAVNIVCVNLSCKLVFLLKGIAPRTWWQKKTARRAMRNYIGIWAVTLVLLVLAILVRNRLGL
ncbi:TIGR00341 family protein [Microbulbifer magnicolonia]|uniref:TIGR00341 family protein n=1 Tax=Microbulbifer magnicolonia TaxID=3109744 RepID=UPI002B414A35|nr:TIGR00341 family protein [Microbulbifer sp. GG15]